MPTKRNIPPFASSSLFAARSSCRCFLSHFRFKAVKSISMWRLSVSSELGCVHLFMRSSSCHIMKRERGVGAIQRGFSVRYSALPQAGMAKAVVEPAGLGGQYVVRAAGTAAGSLFIVGGAFGVGTQVLGAGRQPLPVGMGMPPVPETHGIKRRPMASRPNSKNRSM
ncbi:hypothetical protein D3C78_1080200 [compost metagenome]